MYIMVPPTVLATCMYILRWYTLALLVQQNAQVSCHYD